MSCLRPYLPGPWEEVRRSLARPRTAVASTAAEVEAGGGGGGGGEEP
eukprot:CAMPEP_0197560168 /NCGR_PEP_ID=MMETSP1320-20131121/22603_1 /TAXON_ID=91990 /ORGANISM="Bolidomonas sp., Strain RCC2347" /LENGTH=46 /DNA_ID= /DNA_START= /DNA_END= /DNA_ORIENTATION=